MKKSNVVLLIIVVVLAAIVAVVYFWENADEQKVLRDFAVEDTASIDKIFLANRNSSVTLEKIDGVWMVNKEYLVRKDLINVLLSTIRNVEVSSPVPDAKLDKVLKDLSVTGIKAQIYQKGDLVKTYYVGGVTPDNTGTYMIMEGSDLPFVTQISGFTGYLTVRYLPDVNEWRSRVVFNYRFDQIAKVAVEYPRNPEDGFTVYSNGDNTYGITKPDGSPVNFAVDTVQIKEYIGRVKFIGFEALISEEFQEHKLDSLLKEPMAVRYEVEDRSGKVTSFRAYLRKNINQAVDDEGNLYDWDIDRLYGVINDDSEVIFLQYYILDPISWSIQNFRLDRLKSAE
jgi:hypothetical protein